MNAKKQELQELQAETKERENIVLIMQSAMLAFSATCLLSTISSKEYPLAIKAAIVFFVISSLCFGLIVLAKIHVLHKSSDMHIGHVIICEDHSKTPLVIGGYSILIGILLVLYEISIYISVIALILSIIAFRYHVSFNKKIKKMRSASDILDEESV